MRLRAILFAVVAFAAAAFLAARIAEHATVWFEAKTAREVAEGLDAAGQGWAKASVDGLTVTLQGTAPDETSRFRALEAARRVVDEGRITDATTLDVAAAAAAPRFSLEILRNDDDVSLIGLVPDSGGRDLIRAALSAAGLQGDVADMLETSAAPAPDGWRAALGFGLSVIGQLPRAKVGIAPDEVRIASIADNDAERSALDARLRAGAPAGLTVEVDISTPRPVIAPFVFDYRLADGNGTLVACSAETDEAAAAIVASARAAGLSGDATCAVGLGAPSADWTNAVESGLKAVKELGGGRFSLRDLSAELSGPLGGDGAALNRAGAALDAALPDPFRVATVAAPVPAAAGETEDDGPHFAAVRLLDGKVRLSGEVPDPTSRDAILSFAAAQFGHDSVVDQTEFDVAVPSDWTVRIIAAIEALEPLQEGSVEMTPSRLLVDGWSLHEGAADAVTTLLKQKVGPGAEVHVVYNAAAAAAAAQAARPRPEICADQIAAILDSDSIRFAAGSAEIVPESAGVIAAIADVLRGCPGAEFEIAGHTDSQGAEAVNRQLSEERAEAVVAALQAEDLPLISLRAHGYGPDQPIADNESPEGRASNRRIEFRLGPPEEAAHPAPADTEPDAVALGDPGTCTADVEAILADETIEFEAGSAELSEASGPVIEQIGAALGECPGARIEIGGYTDAQGSESGNLRLSAQRADAVLAALEATAAPGTLPQLAARGYGEADPVADNDTAEGRARNRRIVFTSLPADPAQASAEAQAPAEAGNGGNADCVPRIEAILGDSPIEFAPGSATITEASGPVVDAVREVLRSCPTAALEIGGHTDSEGSDTGNLGLSQRRAEAVLAALRTEDLPLAAMTARGYGEADPVADNATAEGRAENRRIAFAPAAPQEEGDDGSE